MLNSFKTKSKLRPLNLASFLKIYQETLRRRDVYVNIDVTMTTEFCQPYFTKFEFLKSFLIISTFTWIIILYLI